jgi:hypothetical protein
MTINNFDVASERISINEYYFKAEYNYYYNYSNRNINATPKIYKIRRPPLCVLLGTSCPIPED